MRKNKHRVYAGKRLDEAIWALKEYQDRKKDNEIEGRVKNALAAGAVPRPGRLYLPTDLRKPRIVRLLLEHGADPTEMIVIAYTMSRREIADGRAPEREEILDLFRQYAPEQFFTFFCEQKRNER